MTCDPSAQELLRAGQHLFEQGQHAEAAAMIARSLAIDPGIAGGDTVMGLVLSNLERTEEAIASFTRAVSRDSDDLVALTSLGILLGVGDRHAEAVPYYQRAIAISPNDAELFNGLGIALTGLERHDEAVTALLRATTLAPGVAEPHNNLGLVLNQLGRHAEAIPCFERSLAIEPDQPDAYLNLSVAAHETGALDDAIQYCERVLQLRPDLAAAHVNMANSLRRQNKYAAAISHYRDALALDPEHAVAHHNLGLVLAETGHFEDAAASYRQALASRPDFADAHLALGRALRETGHYESAIEHFDRVLALRPGLAEAHSDKGNALKEIGQLDAARSEFEIAIAQSPGRPEFYHEIIDFKRFTESDPHFIAMRKLAEHADTLPENGRIALHFALAKAYADIGDMERSFVAMRDGNALKRRQTDYDEATTLAVFDRIRATFTPELLRAHRDAGDPSCVPIFIVGMPRSGSTLIEQILASHPGVHAAGEVNEFHNAVGGLSGPAGMPVAFPEIVPDLTGEQIRQLGARYLSALTGTAPPGRRVTDKLLANFRFLGLINMALPNARIIHTRRDPVDTCLSCFSRLFAGLMPHTYDLGELGRYYRAYARLMAHWRAVLPPDTLLEVDYADTVNGIEAAARRVIAHCGLVWDPKCLDFHTTRRPVRTASVVQVRQPIYSDSIGRSAAYAPMLEPLLDALGKQPEIAGPIDTQPMFDAALALQRNGRATEAETLWREILHVDPVHAGALHNLAVLRLEAGETGEAMPLLLEAVRLSPQSTESHYNLGLARQAVGNHAAAAESFRIVIDQQPDHAEAVNCLGISLLALGRTDEAVVYFDRVIAARPTHAEAHSNRANAFLASRRPVEAIQGYQQALGHNPNYAEAHNNLGLALQMLNRDDEARVAFEHALALNPDHAAAHSNLGLALQASGRHAEAIASFERALALRPGTGEAWSNLGTALREMGRLDEARAAFEQAVTIAPRTALFYRHLSESKRFEPGDPHLAAMEALEAEPETLTTTGQIDLRFALAKAYGDLGRHEDSFRHLLEGNRLHRGKFSYPEAATLAVFERIRAICTPNLIRGRSGMGDPSHLPVFIVGMPRSGSTLIEQILASHPQVFGAGELPAFEAAMALASGPDGTPARFIEALPHASDEALHRLGAAYVAAVSPMAPAAARVTDKMPSNFLFAGIIHLALPNARIIHTRRDPVDTCLSCFSKLFAGLLPYTYDLAELGRYYRAYERHMAYWREVLPAGVMLDVDYENVIADVETEARRIVAHCGLEWDPRCLDFHLTDRPVRTASAVSVRQPLYRGAVGRWKPYASLLRPLLDALGTD